MFHSVSTIGLTIDNMSPTVIPENLRHVTGSKRIISQTIDLVQSVADKRVS